MKEKHSHRHLVQPVYVGDDVTDEDAFKALAPFGAVGVLVAPADESERPARTHATHRLSDVDDVRAFIDALAARAEASPPAGTATASGATT